MRVITGSARGRKLLTLEGEDVRPTTDRVKEAVFSSIQFEIEGRDFIDVFAGSGQMGIEALSRGAASAVFIDRDRTAVQIVKDNLKTCGLSGTVLCGDSLSYLRSCGKFDLIFVDPPYDSGLYDDVLQTINQVDILSEGGIIIVEARRETPLSDMTAPYRALREYRYGKVKICTYTREDSL